jgi:hypothetical protein
MAIVPQTAAARAVVYAPDCSDRCLQSSKFAGCHSTAPDYLDRPCARCGAQTPIHHWCSGYCPPCAYVVDLVDAVVAAL